MSTSTPHGRFDAVPPPPLDPADSRAYCESSYGDGSIVSTANNPQTAYPLTQPAQLARFREEFGNPLTSDGTESQLPYTPSRGGTLKKKGSLKKKGLRRTSSRRNSRAGSVTSLLLGERERYADGEGDERNSAFYTPVPTSGSPTEILAHRFQAWRKVLKDLIVYFREVQASHESRSKSLQKLSNVCNSTEYPPDFLAEGGISGITHILRDFHRQAFAEASKARDIQTGIIDQLSGLRNDLGLKIKEIKNLSGDFKNSVDKEMEATKKAVARLQDALSDIGDGACQTSGKGDPFIVKLAVDRQVERQINEENYLHMALLNLEASGRELESIVVGEIQKSYDTYAGILKREADEVYETIERLRNGPLSLPRDHEWNALVEGDNHFIDPRLPVRRVEDIEYPGRNHLAASEVRAGMLERKNKYLKSYTPGWYVLSPSHLHEFKSHERLNDQSPVMSLFLPEQKLGSHSHPYSTSHKFMIKGRQTGAIHSRHSWVFRAESHDTMLAWYEDIKKLTEISTHAERNAFVNSHRRTLSTNSQNAGSVSSDGGLDEDEADQVPYSAGDSPVVQGAKEPSPQRPQPGGRFPSELRDLQASPLQTPPLQTPPLQATPLQAPPSASSRGFIGDYTAKAAADGLPEVKLPYGGGHQPYDVEVADETEYPGRGTGSPVSYQETPQNSLSDSSDSVIRAAATTSDQSQENRGSTIPATINQTTEPSILSNPQPGDPASKSPSSPVGKPIPTSALKSSSKSMTSISDLHVPGEYPTPIAA